MNPADLDEILEGIDPTTRTLIAEVDLANEAKEFFTSQVGRYVVGCAEQEIKDASLELTRVWPWRRRRIQQLQNRIWRAQALLSWLSSLVVAGRSAEASLAEVEHER